MRLKTALIAAALCLAAPAALFSQSVTQIVNTVNVGGITGLGAGVAALLAGASSGTGGPAGTTSPTFTTPVLGAASATSINFGGQSLNTYAASTWTPAVTGASVAGTGQTYSIQVGSYEQIGRQVTARFTIVMTSIGTASGTLQLSLPVAAANITNDFGGCFIYSYALTSAAALNYGVMGTITPNTSIITFNTNGNLGQTAVSVANLGASGQVIGICNYRAS